MVVLALCIQHVIWCAGSSILFILCINLIRSENFELIAIEIFNAAAVYLVQLLMLNVSCACNYH